jgi:hypothetical protein
MVGFDCQRCLLGFFYGSACGRHFFFLTKIRSGVRLLSLISIVLGALLCCLPNQTLIKTIILDPFLPSILNKPLNHCKEEILQ